jgi:hypothetical protein
MLEILVINVDNECVPFPKKSKKVVVHVNRKFQKIWAMKMSWVEPIFNELGLKCHVCIIIKGRREFWLLGWILLINIQIRKKVLISGSWIQNVCMLKMKSLMFDFLQPLLFGEIFKQWSMSKNLLNLQLFSAC